MNFMSFSLLLSFRVSVTYSLTRIRPPANQGSVGPLFKNVNLDGGKGCLEFHEPHDVSPIKLPPSFVRLLCELIVLVQSF